MDWIVSPIALYVVTALVAALAAFAAGRRFRVDTGVGSTILLALVAGLVWPVLLLGLSQLAIVHGVARLLRHIDGMAEPSTRPKRAPLGVAMLTAR